MSVPGRIFIQKDFIIPIGLKSTENIHYQLSAAELIKQSIERGEGLLNDKGILAIGTADFTGQIPTDRFVVKDNLISETMNWNEFNTPIEPKYFDLLYDKMLDYLSEKQLWIRDVYASVNPQYRLNIRVVNENPWDNLVVYNLFQRPEEDEIENFKPDWHIIQAPEFYADPNIDGTRQHNFSIINFIKKVILIGGTNYSDEIKESISTILNYLLSHD